MKFDRSNKFGLCYYGQVNSLLLKSSVSSKWASKHLCGGNIYFAGDGICFLLFTNVILLAGSALECFVCNSHQDKSCYDMSGDSQTTFLKDCNKHYNNSTANYTLCRKLHMYMDQDFGEGNLPVVLSIKL